MSNSFMNTFNSCVFPVSALSHNQRHPALGLRTADSGGRDQDEHDDGVATGLEVGRPRKHPGAGAHEHHQLELFSGV